jgi:putative nucleotidyltransferase with HDIG domain
MWGYEMNKKSENSSRDSFASNAQQLANIADIDDVFSSMARMLKRSIKSSWCTVYLIDRDGHGFAPPRTYALPEKLIKSLQLMPILPENAAQLRRMLARRKQIIVSDPMSAAMLAPDLRKLLTPFSLLAVPMHVRQQLQGVVLLGRPRRLGLITPAELNTVRELVSQVSLVASNLRLSEELLDMSIEMAKRIDTIMTLDEINKAISSSLSHEQIFATAADRIDGLVQCDLQIIAVKSLEFLKIMSVRGGDHLMAESFSPDRTLEVQEANNYDGSTAEILHIPDMNIDPQPCPLRQELMTKGIRSLMVVPLVTSQGVQGLLILGDRQPEIFQSDELFAIEKLASQLAVALENAWLYGEMRQMFFSTVASLANAIDAKSTWTMGHSERVMNIAANIARDLGFDEDGIERVRLGGLLHDIGKIGVMEALLEKPAELDEDDFPPIRLHPEKGVAILAPIAQLKGVLPAILHHHEFYDGSGYPAGLAGEAIPIDARIIAVADSFDAMVADRPYRKGLKVESAANELARCAGSQFDPMIVECFRSRLARLLKIPA